MTEYVAGFMFSEDYNQVALIIKNRPEWQKGKANGIGGRVESGETPHEAMIREFEEETGMRHEAWAFFLSLENDPTLDDKWRVHFYQATGDLKALNTTTDEYVCICQTQRLPFNCVPNLQWLIPLAALNEVEGHLTQKGDPK